MEYHSRPSGRLFFRHTKLQPGASSTPGRIIQKICTPCSAEKRLDLPSQDCACQSKHARAQQQQRTRLRHWRSASYYALARKRLSVRVKHRPIERIANPIGQTKAWNHAIAPQIDAVSSLNVEQHAVNIEYAATIRIGCFWIAWARRRTYRRGVSIWIKQVVVREPRAASGLP